MAKCKSALQWILCLQVLGFVSKAVNSAILHVRLKWHLPYCASGGGEKSVSEDNNHGPRTVWPPLQIPIKTKNEACECFMLRWLHYLRMTIINCPARNLLSWEPFEWYSDFRALCLFIFFCSFEALICNRVSSLEHQSEQMPLLWPEITDTITVWLLSGSRTSMAHPGRVLMV